MSNHDFWFDCMCEEFEKIERHVDQTKEQLSDERQLDLEDKEFLQDLPEDLRENAVRFLNRRDERLLRMYNRYMKALVCAVEFKDYDMDSSAE